MVKIYIRDENSRYSLRDLLDIVTVLRGENGCPWDMEQTHTSIRNNLLEEAYEVADAIDRLNDDDMTEELGDLLLQVVFHAQIASERDAFDFEEVTDGICRKLIYRHPHIFGDVKADTSKEVLANWDRLKSIEKNQNSFTDTIKAVPKAFPACLRAQKVGKRAAKAGFDFVSTADAVQKLEEEVAELKSALNEKNNISVEEELGDVLFSAINIARSLNLDAEETLNKATEKFINRFELAENAALKKEKALDKLSADELEELWQEAKKS